MNEHNLQILFRICDELRIHANMIQTSALMLYFCFDSNKTKLDKLKAAIHDSFRLKYNENLQLFTIRHYQPGLEKTFTQGKKIYVEQSSRSTLQMVLK